MRDTTQHSLLVHRAVERFHQLVRADDRLARHLIDEDRSDLPGHLAALLLEVIRDTPPRWPYQLVEAYRRRSLSVDDFDRLGHYLLSTLLHLRVGPDALVRMGTVLGEIRGPVLAGAEVPHREAAHREAAHREAAHREAAHRDRECARVRRPRRTVVERSADARPTRRRSSR